MLQRHGWTRVEFIRKSWPDGEVVYNLASGNTHLISPLASKILNHLSQRPTDSIEISRLLAAENDIELADDLITSVETLLANLESLGLIESTDQ